MRRREFPWDPSVLAATKAQPSPRRVTPQEQAAWDLVVAVLEEHLTDRERRVIEGLFWERKSYRALSRELGHKHHKTITRIRDRALRKLRDVLQEDPR